jgi:CBS domain-containing protein
MAANRIGALAVTSASDPNKIIGVVSERDYLTKVALLGKASKTTPVIQICTHGDANLVTVHEDETVDECMRKVVDLEYFAINEISVFYQYLRALVKLR